MSKKFCPKCGSTETKENPLLDRFCQNCSSESINILKKLKEPKIIICPRCESYLHKNAWHRKTSKDSSKNIKNVIEKLFREKLEFYPEVKAIKTTIQPQLPKTVNNKSVINVLLKVSGKIGSTKKEEIYDLPIKLDFSTCNICKKRSSQYYEAILQIRPKSKEILKEAEEFINNKKNIFITKQTESKHGYDIYTTSSTATIQLGAFLKRRHEGEVKITKTLYGEKDGKRLYRTTVLFRQKPL